MRIVEIFIFKVFMTIPELYTDKEQTHIDKQIDIQYLETLISQHQALLAWLSKCAVNSLGYSNISIW